MESQYFAALHLQSIVSAIIVKPLESPYIQTNMGSTPARLLKCRGVWRAAMCRFECLCPPVPRNGLKNPPHNLATTPVGLERNASLGGVYTGAGGHGGGRREEVDREVRKSLGL